MRHKPYLKISFAAIILALAMPLAFAQNSKTGPKYDSANEAKIKGVVLEIREAPGGVEATRIVVKTDTKDVLIYVAPAAFLKEIDTTFNKGDQVEIVGAKTPNPAEEEILAREITVGSNTFTLRDDKGIPVWAGWKPAKASGK